MTGSKKFILISVVYQLKKQFFDGRWSTLAAYSQYVHNVNNVSSRASLFSCFSSSEKLTWLCPRGSFWRCFRLIFSVKRFWPRVTDHIRVVFRLTDHLIKLKSIAAAPLTLRFCSPLSKVKSLFSTHTSWSRFTLLFSSVDQWITLTQTLENSENNWSSLLFQPLRFERVGWKMFFFLSFFQKIDELNL